MFDDDFKKESLQNPKELFKKNNDKFVNISNTNIRISNIKNYGISQKEILDYFVKVKQYSHTTKEKFAFIKYNKDHFKYLDKRIPVIFTDDHIPYLKLPQKDYELIIAVNFYDDKQFAFYRSPDARSTDQRGFVDAGGGKWKNFVDRHLKSEWHENINSRYAPFHFFELTETKNGNIQFEHNSSYYSPELKNLDSNLIIEKSVAKYLYITTYQNDNYTFYDYDDIDIYAEKEKLDKLFLTE